MLGTFFEAGYGSYNLYNNLDSSAPTRGNGNTRYYAVGLFGRHDANASGYFGAIGSGDIYAEASLRVGYASTRFSSADLTGGFGKAEYDSSSTYYGAHLGLGYLWKYTDKNMLDLSAKYLLTRLGSDSVKLSTGDPVKFSALVSHRIRMGGRFTNALTDTISPYAGAYLDYEFDGKAKGTAYGYDINPSSARGSTGMVEVGFSVQPSRSRPLHLNLGIHGYVGKREGVAGSLQAKYQF
jgi:outer membrane autotransporter protein